jgi:hypothetical protein
MGRKKSNVGQGKRGVHGVQPRVKRPYQRAVEWMRAPQERRQTLSRSAASDWRRIADLGVLGEQLDELGAPYYLIRWVAAPGRRRPAMRQERFHAAVAALTTGRWSKAKWRDVCRATQPIVGQEKLPCRAEPSNDEANLHDDYEALLALVAA